MQLIKGSEPSFDYKTEGIYVGKTPIYKIPFLLDTAKLINPHIAALGMTGSGKTYLLKSILIRSRLVRDSKILIIDWNSEYSDVIAMLEGTTLTPEAPDFIPERLFDGILSIDLSKMKNDEQRKVAAISIVDQSIELMHRMKIGKPANVIVLIDEAWKMLGDNKNLTQLFREGRKYGISVVISTQMVNDINNAVLSNCACLFLFRLQNNNDYMTLIGSGIISEIDKEKMTALQVGSCMVHLAPRDSTDITKFFIKRVEGLTTIIYTIIGDKMQIKISSDRFLKLTNGLNSSNETISKIINFVESNERNIDSVGFVRFLIKNGLERKDVVPYLKLLGFNDVEIVKSYEIAKGVLLEIGA